MTPLNDCLFCKIAAGDIPSTKVYEDEDTYAFLDIAPQAPKHILVIPKAHMRNVLECADRDDALIGQLFRTAAMIAKEQGLGEKGFRLVTNCGTDAMQSVDHFHIHILGGATLSGQMG